MRRSHLFPTLSIRATLVFLGLVVSAMALVMLGTKPAESQQAPTQPLYEVHDLGTFPGEQFSYAFGINEAGKVVGAASANFTSPAVRKRMGKSAAKGIIEAGTP